MPGPGPDKGVKMVTNETVLPGESVLCRWVSFRQPVDNFLLFLSACRIIGSSTDQRFVRKELEAFMQSGRIGIITLKA